ncbi:MDR/zinc-dependent alcohol dehydrogenase-like family protein [Dolichospermum circinale]|uniref:MDR/zinc-dependent alcohol dehydrogenase-like family protein n=1 Tax=Dolichospermum circinale TaxID=109265 RepID=UPI000423C7AB|nr:alcohol dehydrogenase catalytic domain-containing protein [Dolichospermum circinale]MDB9481846.1 alcohol dehydrogenase catalytic domain-containing protein [Dolichospermum circinale CS-537/05]MDB9454542.1 alcohol dehydrogenase catalytic domain-containing protein [Dolichospermum circinale CS-541/06]MDB9461061.1 alcohol dehydrogenase catalytic domain-containing protein [Dolichospermum circinale CS-541/04]MDB9473616.1 alcohol dehydrogenase catalytic domain-containing protein [Dolichospermum circ
MKGLWLENNQLQLRTDIPIPKPPEGEALVRVLCAGICNTDLELIKGYYPYTGIIGHEFVGVVEQGPEHLINQRVVGEINAACGYCRFCRSGQPTHCENRTVLGIVNRNGAFAEYLSLPIENLHIVPENVSTAAATFTEPLAAALEIQQQITLCQDDRVLVVGDGKLGQLIAQTLALTGCDLLVVGRHEDKLLNLAARGIKTALANTVKDRYFDVSIDCTGNPEGFNTARRALRPRGTLILKSTYAGNLSLDASALVVDEITLIGSRCGPFVPALELLGTKKVNVQSLIQGIYPLSLGLEAVEKAKTKGVLKVLLEMI